MANSITKHDALTLPEYGTRCFADIPQFLKSVLATGERPALTPTNFASMPQRYRHGILLLLDAFGWSFFQRYQDRYPFLQRFHKAGSVSKLTSQFPPTTSVHVTTLYTGLPVGQHGVLEWQYYEPQADAMIMPLPFAFAGDKEPETLCQAGIRPEDVLPRHTLAQEMMSWGVETAVLLPKSFAHSSYSNIMTQGATLVPYKTLPEALVNLSQLLEHQDRPTLFYLYFGDIDTICHDYGPSSAQVEAEIDACLNSLESWFRRDLPRNQQDVLLVVTADHGQTAVDPRTAIYLNQLPQFDQLAPLMRRNRQGAWLAPGGSCRDMFLYVVEDGLAEAQALLVELLRNRADVVRVADLVDQGLFGPPPLADQFFARAGNLVILPYPSETVWWYEKDRFEQRFYGHHGGLTAEEMEIPLLLLAP
jgi:hypothetical protein